MTDAITLPQLAASLNISKNTLRVMWNVNRPAIEKQKLQIADTGRARDAYSFADVCEYMRRAMPRWNAVHEERLYQYMKRGEFVQ